MKRSLWIIAILMGVFAGIGFASDNGSFAVGFQGIGSLYANARPTVRWNASDAISFDVTPSVSYQHTSNLPAVNTQTNYNYGVSLGIVTHFKDVNGLRIGFLTNLGYIYGYAGFSGIQPNGGAEATYNNYVVSIGVGPDFEYFIPVFPHISIGAQGVIQYAYTETTQVALYGSDYSGSRVLDSHYHTSAVNILGEAFTVRYYF